MKKALVIGIDGVPYDLLDELIQRGVMKGLKAILDSGYSLYRMKASLPDISSVSWTSFMTGVNPGEHGIFGFTELAPKTYELYFPNSKDIKAPFFWQSLKNKNLIRQSLILNIPNTYPAFPVDGLLVSGFVAIDFDRAVYPPDYILILKEKGYVIDVDLMKVREDRDGFYRDLLESIRIRQDISQWLLNEKDWDISIVCITETDRLHHFFFHQKETSLFDDFYKKVDDFIARIYKTAQKRYGDDICFLILSDHGFVELDTEVNLNAYLQEAGILKIDKSREFYEKIDKGTIAFAMDPGRIYINYKGRFPRGSVRVEETEAVKKQIKESLFNLRDKKGQRIIRHVFEKEEIYRGRFIDYGPDLVCIPDNGFDLKGNLRKDTIFTKDIFEGMHTWDNAVLIVPKNIKVDGEINIEFPSRIITDYFEKR
ncbi:MAG: alkaline phosphatase family protein [Syntrophorhabdaceae bacterium]|nr:alkaline phosphatase family protein [Syntrophorhabdaceae bacterium]